MMRQETTHAISWSAKRAGLVLLWGAIAGALFYSPLMPTLEGMALPVTTKIEIVGGVERGWDGIDFRFAYTKLRNCELLGTDVRGPGGKFVYFYPLPQQGAPQTRGLGPQVSNKWHLGADSLEGLQMTFIHRCQPLWVTVTKVWP